MSHRTVSWQHATKKLRMSCGIVPELSSINARVGNVRIFGAAAIVVGTYIERRHGKDQPKQDEGVFIHVYIRERGNWVCVSSQRTFIVKPTESKGHRSQGQHNRDQHPPFPLPLPSQ